MSKKLGIISKLFPRFSRKMKRIYNEADYRLRKNKMPYSNQGLKRAQLFFNAPNSIEEYHREML